MKILLILGSYPPDACGIGDYSKSLHNQLEKSNSVSTLIIRDDLELTDYLKIYKKSIQFNIVNLQVPALHFEGKLTGFLLPILLFKTNLVLTCHEFVHRSMSGKVLMLISFFIAKHIIFTTKAELSVAAKWYPFVRKKSSIIQIGSNIAECQLTKQLTHQYDICFFGLIRDGKGIEMFLDVVKKISSVRPVKILFCGMLPFEFVEYFEKLKPALLSFNCNIVLGKSEQEVACLLKQTKVTLLPFPDGISARRGSALAAMLNQSLVITTPSADVSEQVNFKNITLIGKDITELTEHCLNVLSDYDKFYSIVQLAYRHASKLSWSGISEQYLNVFQKLIK